MPYFENYGDDYFEFYSNMGNFKDKKVTHIHPHYEMMIVVDNFDFITHLNGEEYLLDCPSIILCAPYCQHFSYKTTPSNLNSYVFYFGSKMIERFSDVLIPFTENFFGSGIIYKITQEIAEQIKQIIKLMFNYKNNSYERQLLFVLIIQTFIDENFIYIKNTVDSDCSYIKDVIKYIVDKDCQQIGVAEISNDFFVSRDKLNRDFKTITGTTPHKFVIELRINKAKTLLTKSKLHIFEIAAQCGFENDLYFYPFFKKQTGMTPKQYCEINHIVFRQKKSQLK